MQKALVFIVRFCPPTCAAILTVTAALKLIGVAHDIPLWAMTDPIFGMPLRVFLSSVAGAELLLATLIVFSSNTTTRCILQLIPCMSFVAYRIGHAYIGGSKPCPCLGAPEAWWPWLAANQEKVSAVLLVFMLAATVLMSLAAIPPLLQQRQKTITI